VPITVLKEIEGFIVNRLQGALLAEAFKLTSEGLCDAGGSGPTVKDGLGLRWSFMGPFETIEMNAPGGIPGLLRALYRLLQAPGGRAGGAHRLRGAGVADHGPMGRCTDLAAKMRWRDRRLAHAGA
jgi:L-gulonate 3-dehydrogenase